MLLVSQASVILLMSGGGVPPPREGVCSQGVPDPGGSAPRGSVLWGVCSQGVCSGRGCLVETAPRDGYCCGRYASYWNAFMFCLFSHWIESVVKTNGAYWKLNITLGCDYFQKQTSHITKTRLHYHEYMCYCCYQHGKIPQKKTTFTYFHTSRQVHICTPGLQLLVFCACVTCRN